MAAPTTFSIVTIRSLRDDEKEDTKAKALAEKFRELRLRALKLSPEAFASTYEEESQRDLDHTLDRLSNRKATHFIALKNSVSPSASFEGRDDIDRSLEAEWLGLIVLLGPQEDEGVGVDSSQDPFKRMASAGREEKMLSGEGQTHAPAALHYHLNGMFVDPAARGGGVGLALIDAAVRRAEAEAAKFSASLRITIAVYGHNVSARKLYEKAGFKEVYSRPSKTKGSEVTAVDMEILLAATS